MRIAGSGRSTRNMHAPSSDFAMTMPTLAPSAPVMNVLRPLMTQWLPSSRHVVCIIDGSEPAPPSSAGSVMKNAERALPDTSGSRKRSFCSALPTLPSRYILPSSGAIVLQASGPKRREAGFDQRLRGLALGEMRSVRQNMRRQDARLACLVTQFLHQFVARTVRTRPRILLVGDHVGADESLDLGGNGVGSSSHGCGYSGRSPSGRRLGSWAFSLVRS